MPALKLIRGGAPDPRAKPCASCAGAGCAACDEVGTEEARQWRLDRACYRTQIIGMPDAQLSEAALYTALDALRPLASRHAWYARVLVEAVLDRAGLEVEVHDLDGAS